MTQEQKAALLKSIMIAGGLVSPSATDAEVQQALAAAQLQDPAGTHQALQAGGYPTFPWLTVLGLAGGAVALYFVWQNYNKTRKIDGMEYPDVTEDNAPRLRGMSQTLGRFRGSSGCRRLGAAPPEKYEFEPESRLEGYRGNKRRISRSRR